VKKSIKRILHSDRQTGVGKNPIASMSSWDIPFGNNKLESIDPK